MLSFRSFVILAVTGILSTGCMERRLAATLNEDGLPSFLTSDAASIIINPDFFKEIPGIGSDQYLTGKVITKPKAIEIYRATFRERFFEKNNLLEYSEFNDSTNLPTADYLDVIRYSQDLYMLKYHFEWRTSSTSSANIPQDCVIFFSLKKNSADHILGIVPCYFGTINDDYNYIAFDRPLVFKEQKNKSPFLKMQKRNKDLNGLLFMPAAFPDTNVLAPRILNIEKIVSLNPNKIGGNKPLVFNISKIFNDKSALQFHFIKTLVLTQ